MNCVCHHPTMEGFFNQFMVNHALPQTTIIVTNDTGGPQQIVFYGGDISLRPVQLRTPSGILMPGENTQFTFLPQSTRRLVSVLDNPNNIGGTSRVCDYGRRMDPVISVSVTDILNCAEERHWSYS